MTSLPLPGVTLRGSSVTLRTLQDTDAAAFSALCRDPLIQRWTSIPAGYTMMDALDRVRRDAADRDAGRALRLVICDTASDELLGAVDLRFQHDRPGAGEVAYMLGPAGRGRGVMTCAVRMLAAWAFQQRDLHLLWLTCHPGNEASARVAERAGFTCAGEHPMRMSDGRVEPRLLYERRVPAP